MNILAIETSCDETAIAVVKAQGDNISASFTVLGNALMSQIELHKEYGGVFPTLAKREHIQNSIPLVHTALEEASLLQKGKTVLSKEHITSITKTLAQEPELIDPVTHLLTHYTKPNIDAIAVTHGPGLAPALWVGVNVATILSQVWDIPLIPVNHMEGHILSSLLYNNAIEHVELPLLALLISGGHTELVLMKNWREYEIIGRTLDDAVGEAFDKVARMMDLPYPGGPEISKLAESARAERLEKIFELPRPMMNKQGYDFSFAGLKTAVLYTLKKKGTLSDKEKKILAREFEDAVTEVLVSKTLSAIEEYGVKTVVLGGGVSANTHVRNTFSKKITEYPHTTLQLPEKALTTDNAIMIALAGFYAYQNGEIASTLSANSNLSL